MVIVIIRFWFQVIVYGWPLYRDCRGENKFRYQSQLLKRLLECGIYEYHYKCKLHQRRSASIQQPFLRKGLRCRSWRSVAIFIPLTFRSWRSSSITLPTRNIISIFQRAMSHTDVASRETPTSLNYSTHGPQLSFVFHTLPEDPPNVCYAYMAPNLLTAQRLWKILLWWDKCWAAAGLRIKSLVIFLKQIVSNILISSQSSFLIIVFKACWEPKSSTNFCVFISTSLGCNITFEVKTENQTRKYAKQTP